MVYTEVNWDLIQEEDWMKTESNEPKQSVEQIKIQNWREWGKARAGE